VIKREYRTILIDPPWQERGGGRIKRGADRHYRLLSTPEIIATILRCELFRPAPSAHLYLWVTNNFLPDGLLVVQALGFHYKTLLTWAKDRFGLGQYFRGQTEHMIFATRGPHLAAKAKNHSTLIYAKRGRHSAKPEAAYELIEAVSPAPTWNCLPAPHGQAGTAGARRSSPGPGCLTAWRRMLLEPP
jgi:N6-adenosine-specific RNA methylase IME4